MSIETYFPNNFIDLPTEVQELIFEYGVPRTRDIGAGNQNDESIKVIHNLRTYLWDLYAPLNFNLNKWKQTLTYKWVTMYNHPQITNNGNPKIKTFNDLGHFLKLHLGLYLCSSKKPYPDEIHPQAYIDYENEAKEAPKDIFVAENMGPSGPALG